MIVFGLGLSITVAPLTATVLAAAPARHAGPASESWHRMTQLDKVVFSSTLQQRSDPTRGSAVRILSMRSGG